MKVLLIKTSSLGDVIHMLPALTDAGRAISDIQFDWVVEEGFAEIPKMHPLVNRVIPVAIRRWRKHPIKSLMSSEWRHFVKALRETKYDYVVDAQGLIKSAVLARMAKGFRIGLDKSSLTESLAVFAYQKKVTVDLKEHAVFRMRSILAQALDYPLPETSADYSLAKETFPKDSWSNGDYVVFIHGTTWATKFWPDTYWVELAQLVAHQGYKIRLPWKGEAEKARAERLKRSCSSVDILSPSSLSSLASVLAGAKAVVAVDTGLGHLAAALDCPIVSLYGPTDPKRIGTVGKKAIHLSSSFECLYCDKATCRYAGKAGYSVMPACFEALLPSIVFEEGVLKALS